MNAEMARLKQHERESPEWMAALRTKFVEQAMSYIGTPYAKKYHEPNCVLILQCYAPSWFKVAALLFSSCIQCQVVPGLLWTGTKSAERSEGRIWFLGWSMEPSLHGELFLCCAVIMRYHAVRHTTRGLFCASRDGARGLGVRLRNIQQQKWYNTLHLVRDYSPPT